jgi:hypothetical protein
LTKEKHSVHFFGTERSQSRDERYDTTFKASKNVAKVSAEESHQRRRQQDGGVSQGSLARGSRAFSEGVEL